MKGRNEHDNRESWLKSAVDALRPIFAEYGYTLPEKIKASVGFPSTGRAGVPRDAERLDTASRGRRAETWHADHSSGGWTEIFIRPDLDSPRLVLNELVHELIHVAVGFEAKHGKPFRDAVLRLGLDDAHGMKAAYPGRRWDARLEAVAKDLGTFPHAGLDLNARRQVSDRPKKQGARLFSFDCAEKTPEGPCGYLVQITRVWIEKDGYGPPPCPKHGAVLVRREKPTKAPKKAETVVSQEVA